MIVISVKDIHVNYTVKAAADIVKQSILERNRSATLVDEYYPIGDNEILIQVFDKFFIRNGSRASLAVTYTRSQFGTDVHVVGSGGSQSVFSKFDFGATNEFVNDVQKALEKEREF